MPYSDSFLLVRILQPGDHLRCGGDAAGVQPRDEVGHLAQLLEGEVAHGGDVLCTRDAADVAEYPRVSVDGLDLGDARLVFLRVIARRGRRRDGG